MPQSPANRILIQTDGPIGRIIINNPEKRNAFDLAMWAALPAALDELNARSETRVILISGAGEEAFVAGADISEFESLRKSPADAREYNAVTDRAFQALGASHSPTVAVIHGYCFGGGCAIALNCDLRLASADASFCIPPAKLGLGYGYENVQRLATELGPAVAREMLFTARVYEASEALRIGILHQLAEDRAALIEASQKLAKQISNNAPLTVRSAKLALRSVSAGDAQTQQELRAAAEAAMDRCYESADYREGVSAFLEKRRANFKGE